MRRDSIFYQLFQQFPSLLFQLVDAPPTNASAYRFESVAVKEAQFQIDGVFLPPETAGPGTIYFCEVQFQRDEQLYERLFAELFLYFYRHRGNFSDWQAVIIYPHRNTEQAELTPYAELLNSGKVHRIFIDELGEPENLSPELGLMRLTIEYESSAPRLAGVILTKAEASTPKRQAIIDLVTTIMVYKFTTLSRQEVEAMLGFTVSELQQSRFYQEVKDEGRQEGRQEGE
ncbi:Rpn family recombination-promoting nuclease/putative transposase [Synechococcus sp. PCC 6312]|uniref:Rpn family recombination-promoting nuclease/putative transposase n=1 Tax=Synechococcus sp. (strain ATCC 27167 / PCC 6312) TaxID=195253 RepID=UPI0002F7BEA8|nr:Rpn family recombination-promoting nuclease/putative transposase [Synechococcus sp. PCC 6312]